MLLFILLIKPAILRSQPFNFIYTISTTTKKSLLIIMVSNAHYILREIFYVSILYFIKNNNWANIII